MMTRLIPILCLLAMGSLSAACESDHPLTLSEAIDIGLRNNPETQQAWWRANRAAASVGSAKSAYYPKLDFNANIDHGRDFQFINGPDTNYTILSGNLYLSMMLFDFGERDAGVRAAQMALLAANWQLDATLQRVMVRVLENAYSTLHAQEVLRAALASRDDARSMLDAARDLNNAGLSPITDIYSTQATLAQMEMEVALQAAQLDIQMGKLATSMGLCVETPIELVSIDMLPLPQQQDTECLIELAMQQRADLMAKQARVSESLAKLAKSRVAYAPKVSLAGRGGADHAFHDKADAGHYQIALNLDIPIFTGFEACYQHRAAYADSRITMEELAQLQLDIALEVLTYSRTLEAAQTMIRFAADNVENAQKAYEGTLDKYRAGKERFSELSNALRQVAAARVRYSDVKTRWLVSIANLAYATGTLAPYTETSCDN